MLFRKTQLSTSALALGAVLSIVPASIGQTTYYVNGSCGDDSWTGLSPVCEAPNGPKATIQAGIDAASDFDSVEVADGVYRGAGNKNLEFFEKEMSIQSAGGPANCIIDCENDGFGFTFCTLPNDQPVTIEGFTIRNGRHFWAGGICISAADVTIDNCIIERCVGTGEGTSTFGGAVMIKNSPVLISNTIIRSNTSGADFGNSGSGAGIYSYGDSVVTIEDSRIEDNEAITTFSGDASGGGVYSARFARLIMTRCSVTGNHITATGFRNFCVGGGLFVAGGSGQSSSITDSEISHNWITADDPNSSLVGGGASLGSDCDVTGCMVTNNTAREGGGFALGSGVIIEDTLIADNEAVDDGGGVLITDSSPQLYRDRILRNTAGGNGGGVSTGGVDVVAGVWQCEIADNRCEGSGGGVDIELGYVNACWVFRNTAGADGGGVAIGDFASLHDSLITSNQCEGSGGGVFANEPSARVSTSTIVDNVAGVRGGGLYVARASGGGEQPFSNLIVRGNAPESVVDASGALELRRSNIEGGWPGVGNLDVDPRFVDPAHGDYGLGTGSPCIDAGDNSNIFHNSTDLSGLPRRVDDLGMPDSGVSSAPIVDMGCYEFQGTSSGFMTVHPRPGIAGQNNQLQAAGATPGNVVYFVYGFNAGSTAVPGCPGLRMSIAHPQVATQATADGNGNASKFIAVPGAASGQTVLLQAVDRGACGVSNVARYRFP